MLHMFAREDTTLIVRLHFLLVHPGSHSPSAPGKENQDTFSVIPKFDNFDAGFFGVYDGHGKEGHLCSRYIRDRVLSCHPPDLLPPCF
jgi:serine/threonine protein phosphatase PrpC